MDKVVTRMLYSIILEISNDVRFYKRYSETGIAKHRTGFPNNHIFVFGLEVGIYGR